MTDPDDPTGDGPEADPDDAGAADHTHRDVAADSTRRPPADLAAVVLVTLLMSAAVALPVVRSTPLRSILAVPFVLFIPGYAIVAALFPEAGAAAAGDGEAVDGAGRDGSDQDGSDQDGSDQDGSDQDGSDQDGSDQGGSDGAPDVGLTYVERAALSFGVSIAVVPLVGLILNITPFGIRLAPVLLSVAGVTLVASTLAVYRRRQLPASDRFAVPYRQWGRSVVGVFSGHESNLDRALTVLTVVALLLAVTSAGYAFAVPKQADAFTELYLVTERDDGELVADDYPTEFVRGESKPLVVGVGNYEHRSVEYSLVVELQNATVENNSTRIHGREELSRQQLTLADEETWEHEVNVTPETTGERLRLSFILFKGDPPSRPSAGEAYREVHLWVAVSERSQQS